MLVGCVLPSLNAYEFPLIKKQLKNRGVRYGFKRLKTGGGVFFFEKKEMRKLPKDDKGPYLPLDEETGYSVYNLNSDKAAFEMTLTGLEIG